MTRFWVPLALAAVLPGLVAACTRSGGNAVAARPCESTFSADFERLTGSRLPGVALPARTAAGVHYEAATGAADYSFSYDLSSGTCMLGHVDVRWVRRDTRLTLLLSGGNLRSISLHATASGPAVDVVDRWGRVGSARVPWVQGLTLWGDRGPLHAAVAGRWQTQDLLHVVVARSGPTFVTLSDPAQPWPTEWDVAAKRYVTSPGAYGR